jgi:DNA-binding PadR family transcriptional regulator
MKRTIFRFRVLRTILESKSVNAYTIWKDFSSNKHIVGRFGGKESMKSEIYNILNSFEKSGHIAASPKIENGRLKNYYKLTKKGETAVKSAKKLFVNHFKEMSLILNA